MSWQTTLTRQGLEILAGLDDNRVEIVSAIAGTGVVPEEQLQEQTTLANPKQSLAIIEDSAFGNQRTLRLQLRNADLETGYTLNQLGVFISVDGGEPILYYIAQNDRGDPIPSKDTLAEFMIEYITTLIFSMRSDVTVEYAETVFVTHDALDAKLNASEMTQEDIIEVVGSGVLPPDLPDYGGVATDEDINNIFN